jgi:hypothetical protein
MAPEKALDVGDERSDECVINERSGRAAVKDA